MPVYVAPGYHRRGVGRRLYSELFHRLSKQGFYNAYAGICLPNPASVAFHESCGFSLVGVYDGVGFKLGHWRDVGWWVRRLRNSTDEPEPPTPPLPPWS